MIGEGNKPCPFCGSFQFVFYGRGCVKYFNDCGAVGCENCHAVGPIVQRTDSVDYDKELNAWNNRSYAV